MRSTRFRSSAEQQTRGSPRTFAQSSTFHKLRRLAPFQRDQVVERILRADRELRPWLPELLSVYRRKGARRLPPLIRDSVSH